MLHLKRSCRDISGPPWTITVWCVGLQSAAFRPSNSWWYYKERIFYSFLWRVAGCFLRDRVRSSVTQEEPGVEKNVWHKLLHVERRQLRLLRLRMPAGCLPGGGVSCMTHREETPGGGTMSLGWPGNASRFPPEEIEELSGQSEVWVSA